MGPIQKFGLVWITLTFPVIVFCSGVFETRVDYFTNPFGVTSDNICCDGVRNRSGICTSPCRVFFRICLKEYKTHVDTESPSCTFGSETTEVVAQTGNTYSPADSNSVLIQFPFKWAWPGTFSLIVEVWHDQTGAGPKQGSPRAFILRSIHQGSVTVGSTWQREDHTKTPSQHLQYSYRVVCDPYFYGPTCIKECKARDDNFGHYTCGQNGTKICMSGWTGEYCDKAKCLPGCHEKHGSCTQPNECVCALGWKGRFCDECIPYPGCQNGVCKNKFECLCDDGWGGLFCNQDQNYCTNRKPCRNGGTCIPASSGSGSSYDCQCPPGYTGTNCEFPISDCSYQHCLNGGTCKEVDGSGFVCHCLPGFQGARCQASFKSCEENPCQHGSTCTTLGDSSYKCTCVPGYTGVNCEVEEYDCEPNPCENGGRCVDERNGYRCVCPPGYEGDRCQKNHNDCMTNSCMNGGTCVDLVNDFQCRCIPGFQGALCQENVNECLARPCANNGICHDLNDDYLCDCPEGFSGKDCGLNINECDAMPCQNGGICEDLHNDYKCTCSNGYYGKNCESVKNQSGHPSVSSTPRGVSETVTQQPAELDRLAAADSSQSTMQTVLYVCVGIGLPCLIIIVILLIWWFLRQRRMPHTDNHSVQKDNEHNERMNNKIKSLESDITPSPSVKVTNEEQSSSRTLNINKNNLNLHNNSNKIIYKKELNTRHSSHSSKILDCNKLVSQQNFGCSQTSVLPTLESARASNTSESQYPSEGVHYTANSHPRPTSTGSIYFVEQHPPYTDAVLATEV